MQVDCRVLSAHETTDLLSLYSKSGRHSEVKQSDRLFGAFRGTELVAGLRLDAESGALVLRGMHVAKDLQGRGLGSQLLRLVVENIPHDEACWCLAYPHLQTFYGAHDFRIPAHGDRLPAFLGRRLQAYKDADLDVLALVRPPQRGA